MSWKLLCWGKEIVDTTMQQIEREREKFLITINSLTEAVNSTKTTIDRSCNISIDFHAQVNEAHKHQREEHQKMINALDRQMTNMDMLTERIQQDMISSKQTHDRQLNCLNEIEKSLGRINGYKNEH